MESTVRTSIHGDIKITSSISIHFKIRNEILRAKNELPFSTTHCYLQYTQRIHLSPFWKTRHVYGTQKYNPCLKNSLCKEQQCFWCSGQLWHQNSLLHTFLSNIIQLKTFFPKKTTRLSGTLADIWISVSNLLGYTYLSPTLGQPPSICFKWNNPQNSVTHLKLLCIQDV